MQRNYTKIKKILLYGCFSDVKLEEQNAFRLLIPHKKIRDINIAT